jgi:hypothetical protein
MNAIEVATLEEVTKDDETPAAPDQVEGLVAVANGGSPEAQKDMATWLASRLGVDSIPVKLKTLRLMTILNGKGGSNFKLELRNAATEIVQGLTEFSAPPDPVHGDKPAEMVRNFAGTAYKILESPPEEDKGHYEQQKEGIGGLFKKGRDKASKLAREAATNIETKAGEALHAAQTIAHEQVELCPQCVQIPPLQTITTRCALA